MVLAIEGLFSSVSGHNLSARCLCSGQAQVAAIERSPDVHGTSGQWSTQGISVNLHVRGVNTRIRIR